MHCHKIQLGVAVLGILLGSAGCQNQPQAVTTPRDTRETDEAAVRFQADAWFKAILDKDLDRTLSFYAEEAEYLPAGRAAASTSSEIRKVWEEDYALPGFASNEVTKKIEVARSGDLAYQTGTYEVTTLTSKGKPSKSTGKFVVVWKKQADGKWKAVADIDNADR